MKITLRSLRISEYDEIIRILQACGMLLRLRGRDSRERFARQMRANRTAYIGAFDGASLVGVVLGTHDTRKGWINKLAVLPGYRRHGIASRLVLECERVMRGHGIDVWAALVLPENGGSQALFTSLGYETMPFIYFVKKSSEDA